MLLQERILQTLEKTKKLDQRKLSHIAGVSDSSFSRYLHGYENISLHSALKIVKYLYPDQEIEIMSDYVLTQKSRNARFSLEYCDMNNLSEQSKQLIEILSTSVNPVDKEWAILYKFIRHLVEKTLPLDELQAEVEVFKPKELEMQIMKKIVRAYISFFMKHYHLIVLHLNGIEHVIKEVRSDFLRDCYNIRVGMIMNAVSLYSNNLEKARYYNSLIINQNVFENVKALAYNNLGYTYLLNDYDKSKHYFKLALNLFKKNNEQNNIITAKLNLSFLNSYWKKDVEFTLELDSSSKISNYVYYLIQKDELSKAKELLHSIEYASLSDWQKGFFYFYQGLIEREKKPFYDSARYFITSDDLLHLQLPFQELRALGEKDEDLIQVFLSKDSFHNDEVPEGSFNI